MVAEGLAPRVVVTRPAGQSGGLCAALSSVGMRPLELPLLQLEAIPPPPRGSLPEHSAVDLVIAVSPSAVHFGRSWWPWDWPPRCPVAGVGAGTARAWRDAGAREVIVPEGDGDSEALLADPALQDVAGRHLLILRGEGGRDLLGPALTRRGARVDEWLCYRRRAPQELGEHLAELLRDPPDAWTVTSSEALANLEAAWPGHAARDAPLFAPHPRIAQLARAAGWRTVLTGTGDAGLMAALQAWFDGANHD